MAVPLTRFFSSALEVLRSLSIKGDSGEVRPCLAHALHLLHTTIYCELLAMTGHPKKPAGFQLLLHAQAFLWHGRTDDIRLAGTFAAHPHLQHVHICNTGPPAASSEDAKVQ